MQDDSFKKASNIVKISTIVVGAGVGLYQNHDDIYKLAFSNIVALTAIAVILITLLDKLHVDLSKGLAELTERMKVNFEYHGLLDSRKEKFNANEMRELWPLIVSCIKKDFFAINYLSIEAWNEGDGDNLVALLGSRMKVQKFHARRIFVIDSESELSFWKDAFARHAEFSIPVKYITKNEYDIIRSEYSENNQSFRNTSGLNIIDPESPGIVVDWNYKEGRRTDGANLKRGEATATEYVRFFNRIWDSPRCKNI